MVCNEERGKTTQHVTEETEVIPKNIAPMRMTKADLAGEVADGLIYALGLSPSQVDVKDNVVTVVLGEDKREYTITVSIPRQKR